MLSKFIGVDIFDNPIKAIDLKNEIFIDETLLVFFNKAPAKERTESIHNSILNKKYLYSVDSLTFLLKQILQRSGLHIMRPSLVISTPLDILESDWSEIWKRALLDAAIMAGWRKTYLVEDYLCAAIGAGVPIIDNNESRMFGKHIFIYSTYRTTCIGIAFAGGVSNVQIVEQNYDSITKDGVLEKVSELKRSSPALPESFTNANIPESEKINIINEWKKDFDTKIYCLLPTPRSGLIGYNYEGHEIVYPDNYDLCIVNGLRKAIEKTKDIIE